MWYVHFRKIRGADFSREASKSLGGGGMVAGAEKVGAYVPIFFFFFFLFFSSFIFCFSVVFCFFFCLLCVDIVCFSCFCYFFVLAIVVQSCKIRFERIYLRSVAFKLFFGVVGSLMCFYALRSEINEFLCVFVCFSLQIFLCFYDFVFFLILYSNTIINYDGLLVIM